MGAIVLKLTNFEHTGLEKVEQWIEKNEIKQIDEKSFREILKTINISFILEAINRIQSTLICELKDSYVQQSQRYVTMDRDSYILPQLEPEDKKRSVDLTEKAFLLYEKMSELKEGDFKGRPKLENYVYGIPIEDARYILPLSTKTNICIAMTGDKLYDLFRLINNKKYFSIFDDLRKELYEHLPNNMLALLPKVYDDNKSKDLTKDFYSKDFDKIDQENNMVLLSHFNNLDLKVGLGALTSTQKRTPSETLKAWGDNSLEKAREVAKRVLGYGHESIAEQARTTFGMMCSMVTYHQQIRHRLSENHREDFLDLILDKQRPVIVPQTIKESIFYEEYMTLADEFKDFRIYVYEKYGQDKAFYFLLNCDQIKLIISTNARIDVSMLAERICMNAQWEIRELSTKKLQILKSSSDVLYEKALPSCVTGSCKEGKLTCGKQQEMRKKFS